MDFQGKVIQFLGEKSGTSKAGNPWKKKEWVVETFGQYARKVKVQCFGDKADSINLEPGHDYTLYVDLESREYNGNWYTDVSVYRVEEMNGQQAQISQPHQGGGFQNQMPTGGFTNTSYPETPSPFGGDMQPNEGEDELPF